MVSMQTADGANGNPKPRVLSQAAELRAWLTGFRLGFLAQGQTCQGADFGSLLANPSQTNILGCDEKAASSIWACKGLIT